MPDIPDSIEFDYLEERGRYAFRTAEERAAAISRWRAVGCVIRTGYSSFDGVRVPYTASWWRVVAVPKTALVCREYCEAKR